MVDISKITNKEASRFIKAFLADREINREFYSRIPEDKLDFKMVDTPERKSDSPRESLTHQISKQRASFAGSNFQRNGANALGAGTKMGAQEGLMDQVKLF